MNLTSSLRLISAFAVAAFSLSVRADDTKEIVGSGTYTNSKGGSGTTSSVTTRTAPGTLKRTGTWTSAAGGTGTWQGQRAWNKSTNSGTFSGSATRPNGATSTWAGTTVRNAPGSYSSGGTITLASGKTETFASTETRVAPGTWDKQQVLTTPSGGTITRNVTTTVTAGQGTSTATTTLPGGQTVNGSASFTQTVSPAAAPTPNP